MPNKERHLDEMTLDEIYELKPNEAIAVCSKCYRWLGIIKLLPEEIELGNSEQRLIKCPYKGQC